MKANIFEYLEKFGFKREQLRLTLSLYSLAQAGMAILSVAHDNPAFEHTSFDPQDGGRLFQGKFLYS